MVDLFLTDMANTQNIAGKSSKLRSTLMLKGWITIPICPESMVLKVDGTSLEGHHFEKLGGGGETNKWR